MSDRTAYERARYLGRRESMLNRYRREADAINARRAWRPEGYSFLPPWQKTPAVSRIPELPPGSGAVGTSREFRYPLIERLPDPNTLLERERADSVESVRLRMLWAVAAGGDEGTVARCAVAVIRFVEGDGRHWSDRAIKGLHIRLCRAAGLPRLRFEAARDNLVRELFIPL
jgi:hypothetical protein